MAKSGSIFSELSKALRDKLKEALTSVLPVSILVLLLSLTPWVDISPKELGVFAIAAVLLIVGIGFFNVGADMAMTPMGQHVGEGLTQSRRLGVLLIVSFLMGVVITIAEPDLAVLAGQVKAVISPTALLLSVGLGVGLFLLLGVLKIIFHADLTSILLFFYMILFCLASLLLSSGRGSFLPLSFDSGGVTTGPITVPFIMALGVGIALSVGGRNASENSFGLIALCSVGPIAAVLLLSISASGDLAYAIPDYSMENILSEGVWDLFRDNLWDVLRSLGLVFLFFVVLQFTVLKLPISKIIKIIIGIVYTLIGLVVFLSAVAMAFMPIGYKIGLQMAEYSPWLLIALAFVIGMVVVLAEPAVHVLNGQVEEITGGEVSKRQMMLALSIGVGISIGLSVLRVYFGFSLLYYLVPGYLISLGLSFFVPKLYTAIAFDSGGVASGPLTSSFILPLVIGACATMQGESAVMDFAFGVVAMVAMTPLITIQTLGFKSVLSVRQRESAAIRRILAAADDQIIYFE
ncbi:MAG: DUF1538 domain-containing protein [Bacteroidales bacterium]|jgi:hypothetical protein|nr:DUF1538 domain-containing protein [Bacteroidales bacterium]MBQ7459308.1 DUF1538 domain-containing protein [Bacteroidales bacterium]